MRGELENAKAARVRANGSQVLKCLPATSNAVERGNRRYRKMQKTVYSVRTQPGIRARIVLDRLRDASAKRRADTTLVLHQARAG